MMEILVSLGSLVTVFVPFDTMGSFFRFAQNSRMIMRLRYININYGTKLDNFLKEMNENFGGEGDKDVVILTSNGYKSKFSELNVVVYFQSQLILKLSLYFLSHLLKIVSFLLVQYMQRDNSLIWWAPYFIMYQRRLHFIAFNIVFIDSLFFGTRALIHSKYTNDSWPFLTLALICMFLVINDLLKVMVTLKSTITPFGQNLKSKNISDNDNDLDRSIDGPTVGNFGSNGQEGASKESKNEEKNLDNFNDEKIENEIKTRSSNRLKSLSKLGGIRMNPLTIKRKRKMATLFNPKNEVFKFVDKTYSQPKRRRLVRNTFHHQNKIWKKESKIVQAPPDPNLPLPIKSVEIKKNLEDSIHRKIQNLKINNSILKFGTIEIKLDDPHVKASSSCLLSKFYFFSRLALYQVFIVGLPNFGYLCTILMLIVEGCYLVHLLLTYFKYTHYKSVLSIFNYAVQGFIFLGIFLIFCIFSRYDYYNKTIHVTQFGYLQDLAIALIIIGIASEYVVLCLSLIIQIKNLIFQRKKPKKQKTIFKKKKGIIGSRQKKQVGFMEPEQSMDAKEMKKVEISPEKQGDSNETGVTGVGSRDSLSPLKSPLQVRRKKRKMDQTSIEDLGRVELSNVAEEEPQTVKPFTIRRSNLKRNRMQTTIRKDLQLNRRSKNRVKSLLELKGSGNLRIKRRKVTFLQKILVDSGAEEEEKSSK